MEETEKEQKEQTVNKSTNRPVLLIVAAVVILFIAGTIYIRGTGKSDTPSTESDSSDIITESPMNDDDTRLSDLLIEDIVVGTGKEAQSGSLVSVNYAGTFEDGTEFDSSYKRGVPFEFTVGQGRVIKGWDMGLVGMKEGGKRKLIIPPHLAYGEDGAPGAIPPNSTLVFEIELLKVD